MHEDYVSFEQAVMLKKLGFDWKCNHWYHPLEPEKIIECQTYCNHNSFERPYSAPTLAQTQKWLCVVEKIILIVRHLPNNKYVWKFFNEQLIGVGASLKQYDTYEQALSTGINQILKILIKNNGQ